MKQIWNQPAHKEAILQEIAARDSLPSPSPLVLRLMEMASDDTRSPEDLARVVEQDPGLAARLLRLVNSAFYGAHLKVSSIPRAIMMLGFNRLRTLALGLSLRDTFPMGRVEGMDYEYFWKTSLYRALLAQGLAGALSLEETTPEEIFTTALILEIGLPLLFHVCPKELKPGFPGGVVSLREALAWERERFGVDHREIGRVVLTRWRFPDRVVEQQGQYGPEALALDRPLRCRIVEYGRVAAQILFGDRSDFGFLLDTAPCLGLDAGSVDGILSSTFFKVEAAAEQLRLKVDSAQDMLEVMEKANRALTEINRSLDSSLSQITGRSSGEDNARREWGADQETLLNAVVHEIRNPLMAIGGFARRLEKSAGDHGDLYRYAGIIVEQSQRLEKVMEGFAALSRRYEPKRTPVDLVGLVRGQVERLRPEHREPGFPLLRFRGEGTPILVSLDEGEMEKAIGQILLTGLHCLRGPEGGMTVSVAVPAARGLVEVALELQGGALSQGVRETLAGHEAKLAPMEMDFALLLARKVIEAHGGSLDARDGGGTPALVIRLPWGSDP